MGFKVECKYTNLINAWDDGPQSTDFCRDSRIKLNQEDSIDQVGVWLEDILAVIVVVKGSATTLIRSI